MALKYLYVPSGVKAGTAYGVLPNSANADFSSFVSDTNGTRVDKNGLITDVEANVPRIDYTGGGCPSLLLEPQRTNLVKYSETEGIVLGSNGWSGNNVTITQNYGTTPFTGSELKSTRIQYTGSSKEFRNNFSSTTIIPTASVWIKGTSGETIKFGSNSNEGLFTLNGDWQKIVQTGSNISTNKITLNTYSGATARDVEIYAPQVENGSYATSYIPNYGTAAGVTRSADVGGSTGDISSEFDSREGTFFFEGSSSDFGSANRVSLNSSVTTFQDRISISVGTFTGIPIGRFNIIYEAGGVGSSFAFFVSDVYADIKIAVKWSSGSVVCYANGTEIFHNTNIGDFSQNSLNRVTLANADESLPFKGRVKQLRVYDEALSDTELQELTTL